MHLEGQIQTSEKLRRTRFFFLIKHGKGSKRKVISPQLAFLAAFLSVYRIPSRETRSLAQDDVTTKLQVKLHKKWPV